MPRTPAHPRVDHLCRDCGEVKAHSQTQPYRRLVVAPRCVDCTTARRRNRRAAQIEANPELRDRERERRRRWWQSANGRACADRQRTDPELAAERRRFGQSPEGKAKARAYAQSEAGKASAKRYAQSTKGREAKARACRKRMATGRSRAYSAVRLALKQGKIVRPETCKDCGDAPGADARGHSLIQFYHPFGYAYEDSLTIEWLCRPCREHADRTRSLG